MFECEKIWARIVDETLAIGKCPAGTLLLSGNSQQTPSLFSFQPIKIPFTFIVLTASASRYTNLFTSATQLLPVTIRLQVKLLRIHFNAFFVVKGFSARNISFSILRQNQNTPAIPALTTPAK